jgi:uncharacterized protein YqhQ
MSDIGGQAVIEGVMMKNKDKLAIAVRKPNGKIAIKKQRLKPKPSFQKLPFIRGIVNLIEMLIIGMKALTWSANQTTDKEEEKLSKTELTWTIIISLIIVIVFFVALPYFLTFLVGAREESNPIVFNFIDGLIKISFFLIYILFISRMKEVKTLFQYHGAEHKAIYCHENKKPLTVENAKKYTTLHPRCGSSFLVIVLIISIIVFSILPIFLNSLFPSFQDLSFITKKVFLFISRIIVIPIIAGASYELLKLSAKFKNNPIVRSVTLPGLWLQKITTKEPTRKQIEVAIKSLESVLK